jgi:hypothetical protein
VEASEGGKPKAALLNNFYSRSRNNRVEGRYVKSYLPRGVLRAGLGITEESDAVAVIAFEETGGISICHRRRIERNFTPETFRQCIAEILPHSNYEETALEKLAREVAFCPARQTDPGKLAREVDVRAARDNGLVPDQKERSDDALAV